MMETKGHLEDRVFWLIAGSIGAVFVYVFCITFIAIPEKNIRFADTALGFLLGTVMAGCIAYYTGGTPAQKKRQQSTTTANISAAIKTVGMP